MYFYFIDLGKILDQKNLYFIDWGKIFEQTIFTTQIGKKN